MLPQATTASARSARAQHVSAGSRPVVCHVIERLDYGGAETLLHRTAAAMREGPWQPVVCCLEHGPLAREFERDGITVECLDLPRRSVLEGPAFGAFLMRAVRGLRQVIERQGVTLVHAHLPDCILWATCAGVLTRTPVVGSYHGLGILPAGRGRLDPRNALRRGLYRLAARLSDRTIAVSAPVHDLLCRDLGFDGRRTVLLLNGVDTTAFARGRDGSRVRAELGLEGRRVITCVGRLVVNKGQRFLLGAFALVIRTHPDASLLLVGDGPELPALQRLVRELGIERQVRFAANRADIPDVLAASTLFVLPSFAEGIPLALVEAMAAGTPVIATDVPGNRDVVGDARCGLLVPPRDTAALAAAIARLLSDPQEASAMAARGRARAVEHFDLARAIAATTALYDEVRAERARRGNNGR